MKKLLVLAIVAGTLVLGAPAAISHGTCTAPAYKPAHGTTTVVFKGMLDCTDSHAIAAYLWIYGMRRPPGGSWTQIASFSSGNRAPTADIGPYSVSTTYDCHKDYKTQTAGSAQNTAGGTGHHPTANSSILYHTC